MADQTRPRTLISRTQMNRRGGRRAMIVTVNGEPHELAVGITVAAAAAGVAVGTGDCVGEGVGVGAGGPTSGVGDGVSRAMTNRTRYSTTNTKPVIS